jgi:methylated-DNA-[protein]-cysteine S-methyltransferase
LPLMVWDVEDNNVRVAGKNDLYEAIYVLTMLIPPGLVTTYKSIAEMLGVHPRTIGKAMKENKNPLIIPCHRVIHSNGELGGYSYGGARVKEKLLRIEGVRIINGRVDRKYIIDLKKILDP